MKRRFDFPHSVSLAGGFNCELTNAERNQFAEYVRTTPQFQRHIELTILIDVCQACVSGGALEREQELKQLLEQYQHAKRDLYEVSKAWYAELVKAEPVEVD